MLSKKYISKNVFLPLTHYIKCIRFFGKNGIVDFATHIKHLFLYDDVPGLVFPFRSGRGGLLFALKGFIDLMPEQTEVILPSYVCNGLLEPVLLSGLTPVFCDVGSDLNLDFNSMLDAISPRTLAIIVPHTYGYAVDVQRLKQLVKDKRHDIFIIDDAASGMGNTSNGVPLGCIGDVGLFSLNQAKAYPICGGGLLLVNNEKLFSLFKKSLEDISTVDDSRSFIDCTKFLFNYKLPYQAGFLNYYLERFTGKSFVKHDSKYSGFLSSYDLRVLLSGIETIKKAHHLRKLIFDYYFEKLSSIDGVYFPHYPYGGFLSRLALVIDGLGDKLDIDSDILGKYKRRGVFFQRGYPSYYLQHIEESQIYNYSKLPRDLLILPVDHSLPLNDYAYVVDEFKSLVSEIN